jgi:hypothetical protein
LPQTHSQELLEVCRNAFTPAPIFIEMTEVLDIKNWLSPCFAQLQGMATPHQFSIRRCPGSPTGTAVYTSKWSDTPEMPAVNVIHSLPTGEPDIVAGRPVFYSCKDHDGKNAQTLLDASKAQVEKIADMYEMDDSFRRTWEEQYKKLDIASTAPAQPYDGWWPHSKEEVIEHRRTFGDLSESESFGDEQARIAARILQNESDALFRGVQPKTGALYENQTPKLHNFVLVDMSGNTLTPGQDLAILGNWEREYNVGRITDRDKPNPADAQDDPNFFLKLYEPYHETNGLPDIPLWAWAAKNPDQDVSTAWEDVLKLPWKEVTQMPLSTWEAFYNEHKYAKGAVVDDWKGTGLNVVTKFPKTDRGFKDGILRLETPYSTLAGVFQPSKEENSMYANAKPGVRVHRFDSVEWARLTELPMVIKSKRSCLNFDGRLLQPRIVDL